MPQQPTTLSAEATIQRPPAGNRSMGHYHCARWASSPCRHRSQVAISCRAFISSSEVSVSSVRRHAARSARGAVLVLRCRRQVGVGPAPCRGRPDKFWFYHRRRPVRPARCRSAGEKRASMAFGKGPHGQLSSLPFISERGRTFCVTPLPLGRTLAVRCGDTTAIPATFSVWSARGTSFFQHGSISWLYWRHLKSRRARRRASEAATQCYPV